jgi:hypothetical protein
MQLHKCGAVTRIGRTLVFKGAGWVKWLYANAARVIEYDLPMNSPLHPLKRNRGFR